MYNGFIFSVRFIFGLIKVMRILIRFMYYNLIVSHKDEDNTRRFSRYLYSSFNILAIRKQQISCCNPPEIDRRGADKYVHYFWCILWLSGWLFNSLSWVVSANPSVVWHLCILGRGISHSGRDKQTELEYNKSVAIYCSPLPGSLHGSWWIHLQMCWWPWTSTTLTTCVSGWMRWYSRMGFQALGPLDRTRSSLPAAYSGSRSVSIIHQLYLCRPRMDATMYVL